MNPSSSTLTRTTAAKMTVDHDGGSFLDIPNLGYFRQPSLSDDGDATQSSKGGESLNFDFETAGLSFFDDDVASEKTEEQAHLDSFGFGFQDSFLAIREEASKIDAALAADQVSVLRDEIQNLKKELASRNQQVEELQTLLQLKNDRIGTLELEQDLFKADKLQMSQDLEKYKRMIGRSASSDLDDCIRKDYSQSQIEPVRRPKQLAPPSCAVSASTQSSIATTPTSFSSSISSSESTPSHAFPVLEKPKPSTRTVLSRNKQPSGRFRGLLCRSKAPHVPTYSNKNNHTSVHLQEQVQEMGERLTNAIHTSDELRRRLAMVSRYYERTILDLQESLQASREEQQLRVCQSS